VSLARMLAAQCKDKHGRRQPLTYEENALADARDN
jgi:hypothetical protein